ncbi:ureidoglycolate lyase [Roseovarius sp.]|uniref:ureidoglycolate lyase n=1 Tax=Roseovarius sp. TaxID=1486281 RepID=UPI003D0BCDBD
MSSARILAAPLTAEAFAPFGDVIEARGAPDIVINQGRCGRFHDRARLDFGDEGRAGLSLFDAEAETLPLSLGMMERHPLGSQAFVPMDPVAMLICVAPDASGRPGEPRAFLSQPGQAVNLLRGVWHGVLNPIGGPGRFLVIDRIGAGTNLEEHWFEQPFTVQGDLS